MALGVADVVLLVISIVASAAIGVYHGVKGLHQTSEDYLLGSRRMKVLPLAMSLTVGTVSAITIMGNAGEMYAHGTQLWVMDIGLGLGMLFVAKVFIPIFYPLKMVSLYHYIESRFHSVWLRRATVLLTLLGAYLFIGFLLFPPSIFLVMFTGLPTSVNIVITGLACSFYSSFGGVKAVVYTDVLQSAIMIIGALAIVVQGAVNVGGIDKALDIAYHHGRIEFFNLDFNPYLRHSFWLVIIYGFFFSLSTYGVNQSQTQRAFSTSSVKEAQRVIYYAIIGMFLLKGLVNLSGIVIFANYADCDPLTKGFNKKPKANILIVVQYVMEYLTKIPGLAGLFVASIYAAVLSSVSTQVNSMTALLWEDFLKVIPYFSVWDDVRVARLQKVLVMVTGVLGIVMSLVASKFNSFLTTLFQLTGAVWGPMVGLFLVAVYLPWVKLKGATIGFIFANIVSIWIVLGQIFTQQSASYLPMSHEACPQDLNMTLQDQNMTLQDQNMTNFLLEGNETVVSIKKNYINEGIGFYGISYCLNYCWGVVACIIVAVFVTAVTTPNTPEEVDENLISPTSWRWFSRGLKKNLINNFKNLKCQISQDTDRRDMKKSPKIDKNSRKYKEETIPMEKGGGGLL